MKINNFSRLNNLGGKGGVGAQYAIAALGALAVLAFVSFDAAYGQTFEIERENEQGYLQTIYNDIENTVTVSISETGTVSGVTASLTVWPCKVTVELASPEGNSVSLDAQDCVHEIRTYEISSSTEYNGESVTGDWVFRLGNTEDTKLYESYITAWSLAISATTADQTTGDPGTTGPGPGESDATATTSPAFPTFDTLSIDTYPPKQTEVCISDIITDDSDGTALGDTYHNLHVALESQQGHMFKLPLLENPDELPTSLTKVHDDITSARFQYHGQPVPLTVAYCFSLIPMYFHGDGISFATEDGSTFEHPVYIFGTEVADSAAEYHIAGQFNVHHTIKNAIDMNYDGTLYAFKNPPTGIPYGSIDLAEFVTLKGELSGDIAYTIVSSEGLGMHNLTGTVIGANIDESVYPNSITVRAVAESDGVTYTAEETYWFEVLSLPYSSPHEVKADRSLTTADLSLDTYPGFDCSSDISGASQDGITYTAVFPAGTTRVTCTDGMQTYAFDVAVDSEQLPYLTISDTTRQGNTYSFTAMINDPSNMSPNRLCSAYAPGGTTPIEWTITNDDTYTATIALNSGESTAAYCKLYVGSELVDLVKIDLSLDVPEPVTGNSGPGTGETTGQAGDTAPRTEAAHGNNGPSGASDDEDSSCTPVHNEEKRQDIQDRIDKREAKLAWAQERLDNAEPHQEKRIEKMNALIDKLNARITVLQQQLDCTS